MATQTIEGPRILSVEPRNGPQTDSTRMLSDDLERWAACEGDRTVGTLIEAFGEKSFAVLFVVLLSVPALPLPTGGATHVLEAIAIVLALQLLIGRRTIWLPARWRRVTLVGARSERFAARLLRVIRWLESKSRPRGQFLFGTRVANAAFGALVLVGSVAAFVAPPFSMLDTLPALGVVVLSVGFLLEDAVIAGAGLAIGVGGAAVLVAFGRAIARGVADLI